LTTGGSGTVHIYTQKIYRIQAYKLEAFSEVKITYFRLLGYDTVQSCRNLLPPLGSGRLMQKLNRWETGSEIFFILFAVLNACDFG
jgi:hypothetical protein